jgi:hypothetical protein
LVLIGSKEHQATDWPSHKQACTRIKKKRANLELEEYQLRDGQNFMGQSNRHIFETNAGHFWGLIETRPYMRARFALVEAYLDLKTFDSVKTALDHTMEILRLCRSDNMGVRNLAPHMMLRLGRDQDCYDFVKWWENCDPNGTYDWGDLTLPYLDEKNADVYESVDYLCGKYTHVSHLIAVALLKIRLLKSLENYQASAIIHEIKLDPKHTNGKEQLPSEIVNQIRAEVLGGVMIGSLKGREPAGMIEELKAQILQLYKAVHKTNKHFWLALLKPRNHLKATPEAYSDGGVEEMQVNLRHSYDAWAETSGAIAFIEGLSKKRKNNC